MRTYNHYNPYNPSYPSYPNGSFQGAVNFGQNYGAQTLPAPINILQRPQIITYGASSSQFTSEGVYGANITGYGSSYPAPTFTTSTSLSYPNFPLTVSYAQQQTTSYVQPTPYYSNTSHAQQPALSYAQQPTYHQPAVSIAQPTLSNPQPSVYFYPPAYVLPANRVQPIILINQDNNKIMPSPSDLQGWSKRNNFNEISLDSKENEKLFWWSGYKNEPQYQLTYYPEAITQKQQQQQQEQTHQQAQLVQQQERERERSTHIPPLDTINTRQLLASVDESLSRGSELRLRVIQTIGPGTEIFPSSSSPSPSPPSPSLYIPSSPSTSTSSPQASSQPSYNASRQLQGLSGVALM